MHVVRIWYNGDRQSQFDLDDYVFVCRGGSFPELRLKGHVKDNLHGGHHLLTGMYRHLRSMEELKIFCDMRGDTIKSGPPKLGPCKVITAVPHTQYTKNVRYEVKEIAELGNYEVHLNCDGSALIIAKNWGKGFESRVMHPVYIKAKTMQHVKIVSEHPNVVAFMKKLEEQASTEKKHG